VATPASHASTVSGLDGGLALCREADAALTDAQRERPGAECSSSLSPAFIASNTTFRPPLRSVIELRWPSLRSFSSRKRAASASRSKACSGPCRDLSDPGRGHPTKTQPPLYSHLALSRPAPESGRVRGLSRTVVMVTYSCRGLVPYYSAITPARSRAFIVLMKRLRSSRPLLINLRVVYLRRCLLRL
jgi:hypothetical protein